VENIFFIFFLAFAPLSGGHGENEGRRKRKSGRKTGGKKFDPTPTADCQSVSQPTIMNVVESRNRESRGGNQNSSPLLLCLCSEQKQSRKKPEKAKRHKKSKVYCVCDVWRGECLYCLYYSFFVFV
jgi:hypothetical protein